MPEARRDPLISLRGLVGALSPLSLSILRNRFGTMPKPKPHPCPRSLHGCEVVLEATASELRSPVKSKL